jgi:hypothetical protein
MQGRNTQKASKRQQQFTKSASDKNTFQRMQQFWLKQYVIATDYKNNGLWVKLKCNLFTKGHKKTLTGTLFIPVRV